MKRLVLILLVLHFFVLRTVLIYSYSLNQAPNQTDDYFPVINNFSMSSQSDIFVSVFSVYQINSPYYHNVSFQVNLTQGGPIRISFVHSTPNLASDSQDSFNTTILENPPVQYFVPYALISSISLGLPTANSTAQGSYAFFDGGPSMIKVPEDPNIGYISLDFFSVFLMLLIIGVHSTRYRKKH